MLPLSISSMEAVPYRRLRLLARRMENTEAASVELMRAPTSRLSAGGMPRAQWQNAPTNTAVSTTPAEESSRALAATGFARCQFVQNPP